MGNNTFPRTKIKLFGTKILSSPHMLPRKRQQKNINTCALCRVSILTLYTAVAPRRAGVLCDQGAYRSLRIRGGWRSVGPGRGRSPPFLAGGILPGGVGAGVNMGAEQRFAGGIFRGMKIFLSPEMFQHFLRQRLSNTKFKSGVPKTPVGSVLEGLRPHSRFRAKLLGIRVRFMSLSSTVLVIT